MPAHRVSPKADTLEIDGFNAIRKWAAADILILPGIADDRNFIATLAQAVCDVGSRGRIIGLSSHNLTAKESAATEKAGVEMPDPYDYMPDALVAYINKGKTPAPAVPKPGSGMRHRYKTSGGRV